MISDEDIARQWGLSYDDVEFITARPKAMRVGLAAQLTHFQQTGRFLSGWVDIPDEARAFFSEQVDAQRMDAGLYDFYGRSARRHCAEIVVHLGFVRMTERHRSALSDWLQVAKCGQGLSLDDMVEDAFLWCRDHKVFAYSAKIMERLVRSTRQQFLEHFLNGVVSRLSGDAITKLDASLAQPGEPTGFYRLKDDAGAATLESMLMVTQRLSFIQSLALPNDLLADVGPALTDRLARRVSGETASEMRRHNRTYRLGLYAVYLMARESALIDNVVDLLLETVHRISARSRRKVVTSISKEIERVYGKEKLLADIALASIDEPMGRICDVIFPVANESKLSSIIKEFKAKGGLDRRVQKVMQGSYSSHYRPMLPKLFDVLKFGPTMWFGDPFLMHWAGLKKCSVRADGLLHKAKHQWKWSRSNGALRLSMPRDG